MLAIPWVLDAREEGIPLFFFLFFLQYCTLHASMKGMVRRMLVPEEKRKAALCWRFVSAVNFWQSSQHVCCKFEELSFL